MAFYSSEKFANMVQSGQLTAGMDLANIGAWDINNKYIILVLNIIFKVILIIPLLERQTLSQFLPKF